MAITVSAKKAIKRSNYLREVNLTYRISMRKAIKAVRKAAQDKVKGKKMDALIQSAYSAIDKAEKKNIIHKNNAARKKSRLMKLAATV